VAKSDPTIPWIEACRRGLKNIAGTHTVVITGLSGISVIKLQHLKETGRDVLALNEQAAQTIRNHWQSGLAFALKRGPDLATFKPAEATNKALRALVQLRIPGGNDVTFAPNGPAYRAWKIAHGYPPAPGEMRGYLKRDLARARFELRKGK
jgi:hypothetical protein